MCHPYLQPLYSFEVWVRAGSPKGDCRQLSRHRQAQHFSSAFHLLSSAAEPPRSRLSIQNFSFRAINIFFATTFPATSVYFRIFSPVEPDIPQLPTQTNEKERERDKNLAHHVVDAQCSTEAQPQRARPTARTPEMGSFGEEEGSF
jgi:hypothetical protein